MLSVAFFIVMLGIVVASTVIIIVCHYMALLFLSYYDRHIVDSMTIDKMPVNIITVQGTENVL